MAIYVFLALVISKAFDRFVHARLRRWAQRTATRWDDLILDLLHGPIKVIVFVILLHAGFRIFPWWDWLERYLAKGLAIIVAISLTFLLLRIIELIMASWQKRSGTDDERAFAEQLLPIIRNT